MIEQFKKTIPSCDLIVIVDSDEYNNSDIITTCKDINRLEYKPDRLLILSSSQDVNYKDLHTDLNDMLDIPFLVVRFMEYATTDEMIYRGYFKRKDKSNFIYFVKAGNLLQTNFTSIIRKLVNAGEYFIGILNNCTIENSLICKYMFNNFCTDFAELRQVLKEHEKEHLILEWDDINET